MRLSSLILAGALLVPTSISAQTRDHQQCADAFDACIKHCETTYKDDASGRAACVPQCSGKYAACDAGVAYDKAKPWLEEQAKKTKKFFDDLIKNLENETPPQPEKKDKSI